MDLEEQAKKITSILVDLSHENKSINKINEQRESITHKLNMEITRKRKEIQDSIQKNGEIDHTIQTNNNEKTYIDTLNLLLHESTEVQDKLKNLEQTQKDLVLELNNILDKKESMKESLNEEIIEKEKVINKYKKLLHLYMNFTRIRWVQEGNNTVAFLSLPDKTIEKITFENTQDKMKMNNEIWEKISAALDKHDSK